METMEFIADATMVGAIPPPIPAHLALPQWFKDQPNRQDEIGEYGSGGPGIGTYKRCLPFVDVMRSGYIIPLWTDIGVDVVSCDCGDENCEEGKGVDIRWAESRNRVGNPIEGRNWKSWGNIPDLATSVPDSSFTFINPWIIRTPPGYSSLITQPFNNVEYPHPEIKLFTGLVNTDTYMAPVTFFFHVKNPFRGMIKRGTPLAQVIPIKREEWNHKITSVHPGDENAVEHESERIYLGLVAENGYRERHGCPVVFK